METDNSFLKIIVIIIALLFGGGSQQVIPNEDVFIKNTDEYFSFSESSETLAANKEYSIKTKDEQLLKVIPIKRDTTVTITDLKSKNEDEQIIAKEYFDDDKKTSKKERELYVLLKPSYVLEADKPVKIKTYRKK